MTYTNLIQLVARGEDSSQQFKVDISSAEKLAAEMAAFANSQGGTIFIGVADDGNLTGLTLPEVGKMNQLISNAASNLVRSPLSVSTENIVLENQRIVIVLNVPKGLDKPYFDKNGVIWVKSGSDKRRVQSKEELRRIFQFSAQFHADELPTKAGIDRLDKLRLRDFLEKFHQSEYPRSNSDLVRLLQNMNLATETGSLNLAGLLLFAQFPERIEPAFVVKAIRFPGNDIHASVYEDTEDFDGPLAKVFDNALAFIMRNLHKVQAGRGVNAPGTPEIPRVVFEELLVNALVHRDYMISAPIRLFIFDNRIEIISPGHLPNNLTVAKIKAGNSNIRNPILVSYASKGILPYHGLGSGIKRALDNWPEITFIDDQDGSLFKVIIRRTVSIDEPIYPYMVQEDPADKNWDDVDIISSENDSTKDQNEDKYTSYDQYNSEIKKKSGHFNSVKSISQLKAPEESAYKAGAYYSDLNRLKLKRPDKTSGKIYFAVAENAHITIQELAQRFDMSTRNIEKHLQNLREAGLVRRVGPDKGGYWLTEE